MLGASFWSQINWFSWKNCWVIITFIYKYKYTCYFLTFFNICFYKGLQWKRNSQLCCIERPAISKTNWYAIAFPFCNQLNQVYVQSLEMATLRKLCVLFWWWWAALKLFIFYLSLVIFRWVSDITWVSYFSSPPLSISYITIP